MADPLPLGYNDGATSPESRIFPVTKSCKMAAATCVVRVGRREDACHLLELIRELAVVENELDQVKMTEETLVRDGWPLPEEVAAGAVPRFDVLFAEVDGAVVGFALYFHNYSTWEGLGIYLEDLYVKKDFRGRGIGTQLIRGVAKVAEQRGCARLQWQVIDFNKPGTHSNNPHLRKYSLFSIECSDVPRKWRGGQN